MSRWIENLSRVLEDRSVVVLHGNVRDRYVRRLPGGGAALVGNLTDLVTILLRELQPTLAIHEVNFLDADRNLARVRTVALDGSARPSPSAPSAFESAPTFEQRLTKLALEDLKDEDSSQCWVLHYLDKITPYKSQYGDEEQRLLLLLERAIENIAPNNRLIMVALREEMVPVEIYASSPKCQLVAIPQPDREDRRTFLSQVLGDTGVVDLVANLTDGLYLHGVSHIADRLRVQADLSVRTVKNVINRYRIGETQDHWGQLSLTVIDEALHRVGLTEAQLAGRDAACAESSLLEQAGAFDVVKGQNDAVRSVLDVVMVARAGLSGMGAGQDSRPRGKLFFAGPTGVGKTLVAKRLAQFVFGSREAFYRFDMSECKEEHTISKLIGSPPGYVGYEQGGALTNAVRERPFSVLLFDEIEKAHPRILDIFLQVLDEGRLTDSRGQTVFFTETIIIFTSNIGARSRDRFDKPIEERARLDAILAEVDPTARRVAVRRHFVDSVKRYFHTEISRREILNRIGDNIVPFDFIDDHAVQREVFQAQYRQFQEEFAERYRSWEYTVNMTAAAVDLLVERHGAVVGEHGGRAVVNAFESDVLRRLAVVVLRQEFMGARRVRFEIDVVDRELVVGTVSA